MTQTPGVCDDLERRSTTPSASGASSAAGGGTVVMKQYDTPVKKGFGSPFFGACADSLWRRQLSVARRDKTRGYLLVYGRGDIYLCEGYIQSEF